MQNSIQSKRFVIRKSLIGQNSIIEVTFKMAKLSNTITIKLMS